MVNLVLSWDPGCLKPKEGSFKECKDDAAEENKSSNLKNRASQVALAVKNTSAHAGHAGDVGLISGSGTSPGRGHGYPLQYSCLENPMDRRAWWAIVHKVSKSRGMTEGPEHKFKEGREFGAQKALVKNGTSWMLLSPKPGCLELACSCFWQSYWNSKMELTLSP